MAGRGRARVGAEGWGWRGVDVGSKHATRVAREIGTSKSVDVLQRSVRGGVCGRGAQRAEGRHGSGRACYARASVLPPIASSCAKNDHKRSQQLRPNPATVYARAQDAKVLMRRCGVELNEAIFMLEAAGGDVRAACKLARSSTDWAAPAAHASLGSLTAATNLALANACKTSPPEDAPGSPLNAGTQWPSISQATVAEADDWDLVETTDGADPDDANAQQDDWVELDNEVRSAPLVLCPLPNGGGAPTHKSTVRQGEEAEKPASFKDKVMMPASASIMPKRAAEAKTTPMKGADKSIASACDMFSFDETELHDELIHGDKLWKKQDSKGKRDGHSKNSKKGARKAKRERKNAKRSTM